MRRNTLLSLSLTAGLALTAGLGLIACGHESPLTLPAERCTNGADDDGDGHVDCDDQDCHADPACEEEPPVEDCDNGVDDDGDDIIDCDDQDCWPDPVCDETPPVEDCDNDADDDEDGVVDCADADCNDDPACEEEPPVEDCDNDADDDEDGDVDCADADCADDPACEEEPPVEDCDNDADDDGDGDADCADADCAADPACQVTVPEWCADGVDNDSDGAVDCADSGCAAERDCFDYTGGVGAACRTDAECAQVPSGVCRTELRAGMPGGYCSASCSILPGACPAGSSCVTDSNGSGFCAKTCTTADECRLGYDCTTPAGSSASVCTVDCWADWQCRDTRYCSTNTHACTAQELCLTPADDDGDGQTNCADSNCAGSPACGCVDDDRGNVQWTTAYTLDPAGEGPLDGAICGPTYQDWFVITPTTSGTFVFTATFSNAAGDLDVYLYEAGDLLSYLDIAYTTSDTETIDYALEAGVTYYLLIGGYHRAATTYTFTVTPQ